MVGWIILGVIAALIVVILCLRAGVTVSFGEELRVTARIGPRTLQIIPAPEKKPKKAKPQEKKPPAEKKPSKEKKKLDIHLTFDDIRGALRAVWQSLQRTLRRIGQRIRIDPMDVSIVLGDENPANTAEWYGWVNTAVWTVMPRLEEWVHMPRPHVHMAMDFNAMETKISGTVGVSFRIGDLLAIGFAAAGPLLRFGIPFLKKQKAIKREEARKAAEQAAAGKKAEAASDKAA